MKKAEEILDNITKEKKENTIAKIKKEELSSFLDGWVKRFQKNTNRDIFVIKWCYFINKDWYLVKGIERKESVRNTKTLLDIFIMLVDDVSEKEDKDILLKELLKIPFDFNNYNLDKLTEEDKEYFKFTEKAWKKIIESIKEYPYYRKIKDLFEFDVRQLISAFQYGKLITKNSYNMNKEEYWTYFPQSMQIIINSDIDLMCKINFDFKKIGSFREAVLKAQKMARIGNWLTTWEREAKERDFTSLVFPLLKNREEINFEKFKNNPEQLINKIKNLKIEKELLNNWNQLQKEMIQILENNFSKDIQKRFEDKLEYLFYMHSIS